MTAEPAPERFDRIAEVPRWPAEERCNVFRTRGWTSSVEGALSGRRTYLLDRDATGGLRATAAVHATGPDTHPFFNPSGVATQHLRDESLLAHLSAEERARAAELAGRLEPVLATSAVNTAPFGFTHGFSGTGGERSLRPLVRELDVLRREWDAGCSAVLYVEEHDQDLRAVLTQEGYTAFHVGANCVLPIAWDSFDGYLATLSRKRGVLKERRRFRDSGFTVATEPVEDNLDEMAHLQALLLEKYGRPYDRDGEYAVFASVVENIGEYAHLLVARKDGELLAFALFFEKDGIIHVKMAARDVERTAPESFAHFNVGYYEMVEEALRRGATEINYGPEGYPAKLRRGCTARNLYWYLKGPESAGEDLSEAGRLVSLSHARLLRSLGG